MKKVLLFGDSIRESYQLKVGELLADKAQVWGPPENGRFAKYTLCGINGWVREGAQGKPDVVHWNNGIWDTLRHSDTLPTLTTLEEYVATLDRIITELRHYQTKIIFATSTPPSALYGGTNDERIRTYNQAAVELMQQRGIPVNDLYTLVHDNLDAFISEDNLHLNEKGEWAAARQVAASIERYL